MSLFTRDQLYTWNNIPRSGSLFIDLVPDPETNILCLVSNQRGLPSLRDLYLEYVPEDPSEATFAEAVFGDIVFWEKLKTGVIRDEYAKWPPLADIKRKQMAFKAIVDEVKDKGRNSYQAAKFLIDEPWKPNTKASKAESKKTTDEASKAVEADITRLSEYMKG